MSYKNCVKAGEAMTGYADGTLSPKGGRALARHIMKCKNCFEEFLIFDAAVDLARGAADGAEPRFELTEAPKGFTASVMRRVSLADSALNRRSGAVSIIARVLWGLFTVLLGLMLAVAYNREALSARPNMAGLLSLLSAAGDYCSAAFASLLNTGGQIGVQTAELFVSSGQMSLLLVLVPAAALAVMLRGERRGAR